MKITWQSVKEAVVYVATSEKFIQSVLSGSAFAIISKTLLLISLGVDSSLLALHEPALPSEAITLPTVIAVFAVAFWIDHHTEEYREWVADETGEDPATDESDADGAGEADADTDGDDE